MGIRFNADEVLGMAEQIEKNGAAFYRRAAQLRPKAEAQAVDFLLKLAAMEDQHLETFAAIHRQLPERLREETAADPYLEATLYLDAMADTHGGEGTPAVTLTLTGKETLEEILHMAIRLEEKSILFYLGLIAMVPAKLGRDKVEAIIVEEKSHITILAGELKKLKKP